MFYPGITYSKLSRNSDAFASEFLENLDKMNDEECIDIYPYTIGVSTVLDISFTFIICVYAHTYMYVILSATNYNQLSGKVNTR